MSTYIRDVLDLDGDTQGVYYFCSPGCWRDSFDVARIGPSNDRPWAMFGGSNYRLSRGGAAPCAASEAACDYEVFCAECGVLIASPWRETPVVVNLIERPPIDAATGAAEPVDPLSEEELERCQCGARAMDHEQPFLQCPER